MSHEQLQNELNYTMSVNIIQKMLDKGLVSTDEYRKIDMLNRESFKPNLASLMS